MAPDPVAVILAGYTPMNTLKKAWKRETTMLHYPGQTLMYGENKFAEPLCTGKAVIEEVMERIHEAGVYPKVFVLNDPATLRERIDDLDGRFPGQELLTMGKSLGENIEKIASVLWEGQQAHIFYGDAARMTVGDVLTVYEENMRLLGSKDRKGRTIHYTQGMASYENVAKDTWLEDRMVTVRESKENVKLFGIPTPFALRYRLFASEKRKAKDEQVFKYWTHMVDQEGNEKDVRLANHSGLLYTREIRPMIESGMISDAYNMRKMINIIPAVIMLSSHGLLKPAIGIMKAKIAKEALHEEEVLDTIYTLIEKKYGFPMDKVGIALNYSKVSATMENDLDSEEDLAVFREHYSTMKPA